jgi:alginate O-acetyltransferase complex protein AlgI
MGGSRVGPARRTFNIMTTFVVSGFWHGASWNFVFWGAICGAGVVPQLLRPSEHQIRASDVPGGEGRLPSPMVLMRMLRTFAIFSLSLVFFGSHEFSESWVILHRMTLGIATQTPENAPDIFGRELGQMAVHVAILVCAEWATRRKLHPLEGLAGARPLRWLLYTVMLWDILYLGTRTAPVFIYFQF